MKIDVDIECFIPSFRIPRNKRDPHAVWVAALQLISLYKLLLHKPRRIEIGRKRMREREKKSFYYTIDSIKHCLLSITGIEVLFHSNTKYAKKEKRKYVKSLTIDRNQTIFHWLLCAQHVKFKKIHFSFFRCSCCCCCAVLHLYTSHPFHFIQWPFWYEKDIFYIHIENPKMLMSMLSHANRILNHAIILLPFAFLSKSSYGYERLKIMLWFKRSIAWHPRIFSAATTTTTMLTTALLMMSDFVQLCDCV